MIVVSVAALSATLERSTAAPVPAAELDPRRLASAELWSRDHELLALRPNAQGERCAWRHLDELDARLVEVFVAAEDQRFFEHPGVDVRAIARAAIRGGSGASTISMQLARLLRPHPRTLPAKLSEAALAVRLERNLSKQQILEQYLNRVPLGRGIRGVEAAALVYFGHSAASVTLAEAALLAALAPAPSRLDPRFDPRAAIEARDRLLLRLETHAACAAEDAQRARANALSTPSAWPSRAPHLLRRLTLPAGRSTLLLDARTQRLVEAVAASHRQRFGVLDLDAIAIVVLEHSTNGVIALVGSFDVDDPIRGQVDHSLAARQAGSVLKPFLYALRIESGATADTLVPDYLRGFRERNQLFVPRDNDELFRGMVPLRVALASSLNVPAVATAEAVGLSRFRDTLEALGLRLTRPTDVYGLGLALGTADVNLLALTSAFSVFERGGVWSPPRLLQSEVPAPEVRVFSPSAARSVRDILSDEPARAVGFGRAAHLELPFPVALKTGTSSFARDFWAIGSTASYTVGVWAGNSDGSPAVDTVAMEVAVPVLVDVFARLPRAP